MSDNLMLETQNLPKDTQIKMLYDKVQRLELENQLLKDQISLNEPQVFLKSTHSIIHEIQQQDQQLVDISIDSRNEDDYKDFMKKTEHRFCSQCRSIFVSVNWSLQNSVEDAKQKLNDKIHELSKSVNKQRNQNKELIKSIKDCEDRIISYMVNLEACKKYISNNIR